MKTQIFKRETEKSIHKKWKKTFQIGKSNYVFGWQIDDFQKTIFFEIISKSGDLINIRRHLFQLIKVGENIRITHHKQHKTLKEV